MTKLVQSKVSDILKEAAINGKPVTHRDLLSICEIITVNAEQLVKVQQRLSIIENQPKLQEVIVDFQGTPTKAYIYK